MLDTIKIDLEVALLKSFDWAALNVGSYDVNRNKVGVNFHRSEAAACEVVAEIRTNGSTAMDGLGEASAAGPTK